MLKIGSLDLNGIPRVAVSFKDGVSAQTIDDIRAFGLDIVELRIDRYSSFDTLYVLKEIRKFKDFPSIATIRSEKEGGEWDLSEAKRLELFKAIMADADAIDIEFSAKTIAHPIIEAAKKSKKLVFVSYHNFDRTPEASKLEQVLTGSKEIGADVVKIATLALCPKDVRLLAEFTINHASKNLVTIAMGSEGLVSRIFFPALGSLITYAFLGQPAAPGQLDYKSTSELLRKLYPKYNEDKINSLELLETF